MKKITLLLAFLLPLVALSQSHNEKIQAYLNANHTKFGLTNQDINDWFVESEANSTSTKINNYYIKQRFNGTEIFGAVSNVWVKNEQVINVGNRFIANISQKVNATTPSVSVVSAAHKAFQHLGLAPFAVEVIESASAKNFVLSNGTLTEDPITAELVYQPTEDDKLRLAWDLTFYTPDYQHLWSIRVDAVDGSILEKHDMVISCNFGVGASHAGHNHDTEFTKNFYKEASSLVDIQSGSYRVIPFNVESPAHGPRQLVTSPHNPTASPFGWHDTNGIAGNEFTITRGNNVQAQEDADGNNGIGLSPDGGAALVFDYPYGGTSTTPATYTNASTTNLFYMNNMMHDVWFNYGFNETNGNFQQKNYGGSTNSFLGDAVFADSQDGSTATPPNMNNANFSTPPDGQRPRMQMYLWNVGPRSFFVTAPSAMAGAYQSVQNAFNPGHVPIPVAPDFLQTDLVLYMDVAASTNEACVAPSNGAAMAGKIVLIRRGNCDFIIKVKNAQDAGAAAVVVTDNLPNQLVNMSGADATITIPAVFITKELGDALIAQMQTQTVVVKLQSPAGDPFVNSDGDFDNGIIAHEFGHGISNRLTGGPANSSCLQNAEQAGEGWSDWFALMMQLKAGDNGAMAKGIASFAANQPIDGGGIRMFPYSTDMSINPLTFADSNDTESHNRGELMAAVLWDLTWAYIDKYGFDSNILTGTGGNNKAMQIVLDGLKLQPCSPTFVEYRDAVIAADQATTGGADYCMIWDVFARRGLGLGASSGSRTNAMDQVESFTEPAAGPNCTSLAVNNFNIEDMIRVYPNPSNGMVTVRINQFSGKVNLQVVDINGRIVYKALNSDFNIEQTLNLSHLQSGMYILKLDGEALNYTHKLIIN
ncbi:MAG TPA: T9SS-dependent M36 family metallopeptidase [Flavobacterium sp.]|nr:T9SS-dependent M36 family metallopeptidase [Flavobacterium sp.]